MMNQIYNHANTVSVTAPAGGVIGKKFYRIGGLFGIAAVTTPAGKKFELIREGVFNGPVEAVDAIAEGDAIYWQAGRANSEFSNEATAGAIHVGEALGAIPAGTVARIDVAITPRPLSTAAEAIEQAGGADA